MKYIGHYGADAYDEYFFISKDTDIKSKLKTIDTGDIDRDEDIHDYDEIKYIKHGKKYIVVVTTYG